MLMKKIKLIMAFLLAVVTTTLYAQNITVRGTVTDSSTGEPVAGAAVVLQGSASAYELTNADGVFTISVPKTGVLVVSNLGYKTQQIAIDGQTSLQIALDVDTQLLDEVVVTALGISREKKALGYAVQDLKSDDLVQAASASLSSAIQGKLSGVEVASSSGMPGASAKITIRGSRSLDGNNTPLYVVDGMPVASTPDLSTDNSVTGSDYASRALDIDPNDIESINVLKGQAASALYGMRATNGVIIITTKKGSLAQAGKTNVTFSTNYTFDTPAIYPEVQTKYAQGSSGKYSPKSSLSWGPEISELPNDPGYGGNVANTYTKEGADLHPGKYYQPQRAEAGLDPWTEPGVYNNIRDFFQTGHTFSNNVTVAHNFGNGNFIFSLGNTNSNGIIKNTYMKRYNARFASEAKLNRYFTMGFSGNFVQSDLNKQSGANDGITAGLYHAPANYDLAGIPCHVPGDPYTQVNFRNLTFNNPYWATENNFFGEKSQRFYGNAFIDFKTNLAANHTLDVKYQLGADAYTTNYQNIYGYGSKGGDGEITERALTTNETNSLLTANYTWAINPDLNFSALAGNEIVYGRSKYLIAYGNHFNFSGWNHLNNVAQYSSGESYGKSLTFGTFAEVALDYKNMLFFNATIRSDYVSSMPHGNRTFTYPSVSLGFIFTELDALKNDALTYGKIRASYAEVGQAGSYHESYYDTPSFGGGFSSGTPAIYPTNGVVAYTPYSALYDPNLRPQNTKSIEGGIDLAFFNGRIKFEYTFSRQNVKDQIFAVPMASSTGYSDKITNAGKVHTNAHEITLGFVPVETRDFSWDVNFNFTKIDNYVDELAEGVSSIFLGGFVEPQVRAGIDDKYPVIYGIDYQRNEDGLVIVDEDGFPMAGDNAVLGSVAPDFQLGMSTGINWKGLALNMVFDWKKGGSMYAGSAAMMEYYGTAKLSQEYREKESFLFDYEPSVKMNADGTYSPNDIKIDGKYAQAYFSTLNDISKYFVRDASYLKLREVSLSYPVIRSKSVTITASAFARNILLWTAIRGFDPEASQGNNNMAGGFERFSLPGSSSYGAGLKFNF
ncbi:MAG: SusC/RagA family TonB-linked outer membrane protein [Bacteroidales bacterium]|nr:SusC/RagA family TonB-linked outer membrane protein [Bacteroidales bacterium]